MSNIFKDTRAWFSKLDPKNRRFVMIGSGTVAVLVVAFVAMTVGNTVTGGGNTRKKVQPKNVEFYPLTGKDTGNLSREVMAERVKLLESELTKLKTGEVPIGGRPADDGMKQNPGQSPNGGIGNTPGNSGDVLPGDIFAPGIVPPPVRKRNAQEDTSVNAVRPPDESFGNDSLFPPAKQGKNNGPNMDIPVDLTKPGTDASVGLPGEGGMTRKKMEIREISQDEEKEGAGGRSASNNQAAALQEQGIFMPAGTIISGVLITGMDAPTANQSKRDPFPALLRVKDESILPNRMKMDIRECFIIASGYGDMSSERAFLRSDTVSCVREDGGVIEAGLNAYAVGEDGKNGVRGRLVSKTGSLVAKSLMAGFLAGTADIMKPQKVPQVANVDANGNKVPQLFTDVDPAAVFSQGAMGGVSNSMNRIAEYYIEMAKSIFPIIEVDAGRKIDFVVIKGAKLAIQSNSRGNQQNQRGNNRNNQNNNQGLNQNMGNNNMNGGNNRQGGGNNNGFVY